MPDGADTKHGHYGDQHVAGEVFWGLGIENETYVELTDGQLVAADFLQKNQARERYSVNYWSIYRPECMKRTLDAWMATLPQGRDTVVRLPTLLNGHSLTRCDRHGEHRTTYTRRPGPNPRFAGTTLAEDLSVTQPAVFGSDPHPWWCFDGDTIEITTQQFRNTTAEAVVAELRELKERWLTAFQTGIAALPTCDPRLRRAVWPPRNYGFTVLHTNPRNVAIFNNGTYHINLTAPTFLGKDGEIEDEAGFVSVHRAAARLFQWLSPLFVARFGSPDVAGLLALPNKNTNNTNPTTRFPCGSQRLAASRYVSVGVFDTREMPRGKILTRPLADLGTAAWYRRAMEKPNSAYTPLDAVGFDVNFAKFRHHGLELRIFDWFPEEELLDVLRMCVWMLDEATAAVQGSRPFLPVPQESPAWERLVEAAVWEGAAGLIAPRELKLLGAVFDIPLPCDRHLEILDVYRRLFEAWGAKHGRHGPCSRRMLGTVPLVPAGPPVLQHMEEDDVWNRASPLTVVVRLVRTLPFKQHKQSKQSKQPTPIQSLTPTPTSWWSRLLCRSASPMQKAPIH